MVMTKQTPHGSSSHRPVGMVTARFSKETEESQFEDIAEEDSQNWLDVEERKAAQQAKGDTSKSTGKTGDQPAQTTGGAPAPPEENPAPPLPTDPRPGTSKDPLISLL